MKQVKPKKCRVCRQDFRPFSTTATTCSPRCALSLARGKRALEYRAETKRLREQIRTHSDWVQITQTAFNKYIRARDAGQGCISCGTTSGQMQAGHYRPTSTSAELRFNEINVHVQCSRCNTHLSGNLAKYRAALVDKIGVELVEWLEQPHTYERPSIDDLKWLRSYYSRRAREALKEAGQ